MSRGDLREGGPFQGLGADGDISFVLAHDGLDDGESKAGALRRSLLGVGGAKKPIKEVGLLVVREAHPVVADLHSHALGAPGNAEARVAKTDFVAMVSHELRTPMTNIVEFVELLRDGVGGGLLRPDQAKFVDAIDRNSIRLTTLAGDLLITTGLESRTTARHHTDVDVNNVLLATQDALERPIAARRVDVSFEGHPGPVVVRGDAADLESLLTNLVGNALRFTAYGGTVRCTVHPKARTARFTVSDDGLGLPKDEQRNLFTKILRSSVAQEHAIQRSGLGLTIVDAIVQRHGGDISVTS